MTSRWTWRLGWLAGLTAALAVGMSSGSARGRFQEQQDAQTPPTFRAGTTFVRVDAYPRQDGRIVEDLRAEDFQILENGRPQQVETFQFVRIEPNTPDGERRDPSTAADSVRQAADPRNRVFVIYLDIYHLDRDGSRVAERPVVDFVIRNLGPTDLFATMTPETPTQALTFARRVETLENELRDTASWGLYGRSDEPRNDIEQRLFNCGLVMSNGRSGGERLVALHRQDVLAHHLSALVARLGGLRDERKHIMFISGGWATRPVAVPGASGMGPEIPTIGVGPGGRLGRDTTGGGLVDRSWCNTQISRLQGMDSAERLRNLVKDAHRANVSFHPIDPHGLTVSGVSATAAMARNASLRGPFTTRLDTLRALAENTDGTAIVQTNDIAGPMQRLGEDLAAHYLLGYYSTNPAADGRYRTIEVKVSRPGVHVSARPGYLAPTEEMRRAELAAAVRAPTEPTSIDRAFERIARVRADSTLNIDGRTTPSGLDVVVELASREMDTGRWRTGGVVSVSATTSGRGEPLTVEGRIEAGLRGVIVHLPFEPGLPANRGASWRVTASVTAAGETLRRDVDIATEPAGAVGAPLAYRATPSPRSPLAPVADWQFRRTERLHVEWPTNASLTSPTVRLLSRRGDAFPVPVTVTTRTNSDQSIVVADLVLSAVAQGDYALQLSATSGDASVSHVAAFRVVR